MAVEAVAARKAFSAPPGSNTVLPGSTSEKLCAGSLGACWAHGVCDSTIIHFLGLLEQAPQTEWLQQERSILSWCWRLEVWDQSVGRLVLSEAVRETVPGRSLPAGGLLTAFHSPYLAQASPHEEVSAFMFTQCSLSMSVSVSKFPLFIRTTVILD